MRYLLDTNIISSLVRDPAGRVGGHVSTLRPGELGTSIIVAAELRYGYVRKSSKRLRELIEASLASFEVAPWASPADKAYARLRTDLEVKGTLVGQNDMLIAAHALALGVVLVTDNEREFSRVAGLKTENWLRQ